MNSNKYFSSKKSINFNDYLKNKKGIEILKNLKSKNVNSLDTFLSYQDFLIITKSLYNTFYIDKPCLKIPTNLDNTNTSFIIYENLLSHLKDCNICKYTKDILYLNNCKEIKGILYPYGEYIDLNPNIANIYLHNRKNLDLICNKKYSNLKEFPTNICNHCKDNSNIENRYPSQNNFISNNLNEIDLDEKKLRMDSYAVFPFSIKNNNKQFDHNLNEPKLKDIEEKEEIDKRGESNSFQIKNIEYPKYNTCYKIKSTKSPYELYYK